MRPDEPPDRPISRRWYSGTMSLPVEPPIAPMLARLSRELPVGRFTYEPKWDGFRCLAFVDGDEVDLRSRHDRPLARYFPEVAAALRAIDGEPFVLDGELILATPGTFDFAVLMSRLHPAASRVERLSRESPAAYVAFDLLGIGRRDLRAAPFLERRRLLEALVADGPAPVFTTPATRDLGVAQRWFDRFHGAGIDGIVAKPDDGLYEPGRRALIKVKHERTADCVLAGVRPVPGTSAVSSLLLGLYDDAGDLRHVGVVTQLATADRLRMLGELRDLIVPLAEHPWRNGFLIGASPLGRLPGSASRWTPAMQPDWIPLQPERVCEVGFDQVDVDRFRHPARFRRWRPDREAASCAIDQILVDAPDFGALLAESRQPVAARG
jgi:ATP-dependent DNA ligase